MPFNGSGTYTAPSSPGGFNPAISSQQGTPTQWNALLADLQTALSTMICRDGQSTITANIALSGFRFTGAGNATARDNYATIADVQSGAGVYGGTDTGSSTAYVIATTPAVNAYAVGQVFRIQGRRHVHDHHADARGQRSYGRDDHVAGWNGAARGRHRRQCAGNRRRRRG